MGFVPPTRAECLRAVGLDQDVPPHLRRALEFDSLIEPLPPAGLHDWLASHDERGQTFEEFQALCPEPHPAARPIAIQPIDDFLVHSGPCLEHLVEFARAFFVRDVVLLPPLQLPSGHVRSRMDRETGQVQYFAGDMLMELAARRPPDALCVLSLTGHDIYPDVFVDFAFGEASSLHRVALCSTARYRPPFREESAGQPAGAIFRRCIRVLSHEVCHMLGMEHCVYARCLMNGSADVAEGDKRPLHLCPVDLHKLEWALGFNVVERYRRLLHFWSGMPDDPEQMWVSRRLRHVLDGWSTLDEPLPGAPATEQ
jgi:archaemetzincin